MDLQAADRFRRTVEIWTLPEVMRDACVAMSNEARTVSGAIGLDLTLASREEWRGADCHSGAGMKRFDVIVMFVSLWLLASMVADVLTPVQLSVYAIGATLAPAAAISAVLYWLGVPKIDFAVCFS